MIEKIIIDPSKQAPAHVLAAKYGPGVYLAYEKHEKEQEEMVQLCHE